MINQENNMNEYEDKSNPNDSYNELKTQANEIVNFLRNQFGESFQSKNENQMKELSNQIKFIQTQLFKNFKEDQNESVNHQKFYDFVQKCQHSHDDLSQDEFEIAEIYNELLDYPLPLNQIDITRHHRILSKALELNKSNFNYEKFIEFICESIENQRYEEQSLLIYFDETDFSSTKFDEMKQKGSFDDHFLSYRNDRYLDLFERLYREEQRYTEMKIQIDEILTVVHRNEQEIHNLCNKNFPIFEEIKNELQQQNQTNQQNQQNHELEERILNELKTENSTLKSQLERIEKETIEMKKEMDKKIEEMIQRQHEDQTTIEEMNKLNRKLLNEIVKHFSNLEQTIQIEHNKSKESVENELTTISSKLQELSKLNALQQNQTNILKNIQQIDNFCHHKFSFVSASTFDGILNYLHHRGQVQLTSGHKETNDSFKVTNLIDYSNTSDTFYLAYANGNTNWIEFNFLARKIDLSSYQIKTNSWGSDSSHPKTWEIRGSNDRNHWDTLDHRENCSELKGPNRIKHFTCQTPTHKHYQYIRFYQSESWWSSFPFDITISRFELYGDIYKT